jgi:nucleoside-diphosphate-sugar epimerase
VKAFITGGGGFLGTAIARILVARGDEVTSYSRARHAHLEALGVRCIPGDVTDHDAVLAAMRGSEIVFHTAAKAGVWGPRSEYEHVNVTGTRAVMRAAVETRVRGVVHTSSPSVCFDGKDHILARNDLPLARTFLCEYPRTKAESERIALLTNRANDVATCALRPHLIFGPNDPHLLPRIIERARSHRLKIVGDGTNQVGLTYIDNAAHAHVDAADRLDPHAPHAGHAYFITQEEPVVLWTWIADLLHRLGIEPPRTHISERTALRVGTVAESIWRLLRRRSDPPMTRFVALQLARTHTYDMTSAKRDFGYVERVNLHDATELTIKALAAQPTVGFSGGAGAVVAPASHERA